MKFIKIHTLRDFSARSILNQIEQTQRLLLDIIKDYVCAMFRVHTSSRHRAIRDAIFDSAPPLNHLPAPPVSMQTMQY